MKHDDTKFLIGMFVAMPAVVALLLYFLGIGAIAEGADDDLPEVQTVDADREPTAEQVALGQMLFFDKRLSTTGEKSCASCHDPNHGWVDAGPVSEGVSIIRRDRRGNVISRQSQFGIRRSMTIEDAVFKVNNFHDGRARMLEGQAGQPIVAAAELGNQTLQQAFGRLARIQGYQNQFQKAFGTGVNAVDGFRALAMFERTVISGEAPVDRNARGEPSFDKRQERGWQIFMANHCADCHFGHAFSDGDFHVVLGATLDRNGKFDRGKGGITRKLPGRANDSRDDFKFVTPTLRDIGKRAPYFHAGQAADMTALVEILNNPPAGSELSAMGLSEDEKADLAYALSTIFESYHPPFASEPALPQ